MANNNKVAIVTGSSRGVGRGCALELARSGFDVVVCARSVQEGTSLEHSSTVKKSDTKPLPGSLEKTAKEIEEIGQKALIVKLDLLNREDVDNLVARTVSEWGRIDVLVNNARYIGPGHMDELIDTPIEVFDDHFAANVLNPLHLIKLALPIMKEGGGGVMINVTSSAGNHETDKLIGAGGWGLGYSISKASVNRMVAGLAKEFKRHNISFIGLEPGFVMTERMTQDMKAYGFDQDGLGVDLPGKVCAFLCSHPYPMVFSGKTVDAPSFAPEVNLVDGTKLPVPYGPEQWGIPRGPLM